MSTTFAIFKSPPELNNEGIPTSESIENIDFVEVAFQANGGGMYWKYEYEIIGPYLHPHTPVYPIDNSPQGIYTVKDILREMGENE